jgi:hypothetical protein
MANSFRIGSVKPSLMLSPRHLAILAAGSLLCSCAGSQHYRITLKDGREFQAASKPEYQTKTGYYKYETFQGRDALIRSDEVLLIEEEHS